MFRNRPKTERRAIRRASALLAALLAAPAASAQPAAAPAQPQPLPQPQPIEVGASFRIPSRVLGEERIVNVSVPDSYRQGDQRYPVLYLIDGGLDQDFLHILGTSQLGAIWGRSQEFILVGIATKDRRRELTGPTADPALLARYPTAGHSEEFRRYIREEVMPFVTARYRTSGRSAVIGESLAGLFIVETLLRSPDMFDGYAAVSPSLWWDKERLSLEAARLPGARRADRQVYLATAEEGPEMRPPVDRLRAALAGPPGLCYVPRTDLTHATIYHSVSPQAIQYLFPPQTPPDPQMGFTIACSPRP
jgi:predicted alpha/beta superfamily hydrolase